MWRYNYNGTRPVFESVDSAGPQERRIDHVRAVGGGNENDAVLTFVRDPVELGKQGCDHAVRHNRILLTPRHCHCVDLVKE